MGGDDLRKCQEDAAWRAGYGYRCDDHAQWVFFGMYQGDDQAQHGHDLRGFHADKVANGLTHHHVARTCNAAYGVTQLHPTDHHATVVAILIGAVKA